MPGRRHFMCSRGVGLRSSESRRYQGVMSAYAELQQRLAAGWNTYDTRSVLSHVLLPEAFAVSVVLKEYRRGAELRQSFIAQAGQDDEQVSAGPRTRDGTYTSLSLRWQGIELSIESAEIGAELVLLVEPRDGSAASAAALVELGVLWGRPGFSRREGRRLLGTSPTRDVEVHVDGALVQEPNVASRGPYLACRLDAPLVVSTGQARSLAEVRSLVAAARARALAEAAAFGSAGETFDVMRRALTWNTIYDPANERVISPVSRRWSAWQGGWVLFEWDTFLAAYMASAFDRDLAYANVVEILREKTDQGFVPNVSNAHGFKSLDRSQPPVGSLVVRELYRKFREPWLVEQVFGDLLSWNRWWWERRRIGRLLAWGSNPYPPVTGNEWEFPEKGVGGRFGAALESGLDNSPLYDDARFDAALGVMAMHDVGLSSLYAMDCACLADLARVLGRQREAEELQAREALVSQALDELWDERSGIYLNRYTDTGISSPRLAPTNFYPLLNGGVSRARAERLVQHHLYDPEEFWGEFVLPSIARNDPAYPEQSYWRGRIWAPLNFLVYLGLRKQGLERAQRDLADKSRELLLTQFRAFGHVAEHYDGERGASVTAPGAAGADRFYHWGALLGFPTLIEAGHTDGWEKPL